MTESMLPRQVYSLLWAFGFIYVSTALFAFFGIGFDSYGIYMLFFVCMFILYGILPQKTGGIFMPK
jgi:hypothetical protein